DLRGCNLLANELTIRQISCLINALNSTGITEHFTRLWLQVGMSKLLDLEISNIILDWEKKNDARALNLVFNELFDTRIANEKAEEKTIKPKWISGQLNQYASSILLPKITNDKRKKEWVLSEKGEAFKIKEKKDKSIQVEHWRTVPEATKIETKIEKCSGCEYNRNTVEGNCTMCIKFDKGWKVIPKNAISKIESSSQMQIKLNLVPLARDTYHRDLSENEQEFKGLRCLESSEKELILQAELNGKLKEEILAILLRNLNRQQRKYCYYTNRSLRKENKEKGNIVVMGAAVVQVNEKEEVSLEEHIAMARQWLKQKNSDLLLLIKKAVSIKEISFSLVKVKGYSNNRWNDRADCLA
ncbi:373_t:CDS:2, partial [Gigaspora margarita]